MHTDIYNLFFSGKSKTVKAYGTTKENATVFEIPKKVLRRAYPFMLASAMLFTGCSQSPTPVAKEGVATDEVTSVQKATSENKHEAVYDSLYHQVVASYNLTKLMEKEPLPQAMIMELMNDTEVPPLTDRNYNHMPENEENFWEIVKNGLQVMRDAQSNPDISDKEKKEYKIMSYKMLSQISRIKGTTDKIDLTDYNNLKTFAFFEKMTYYGADYDRTLKKESGVINESNELYGRYYKDYENFVKKAEEYPGIEKFTEAMYEDLQRFVLSKTVAQDSVQAKQIANQMLNDWMAEQHIEDDNLYRAVSVNGDEGYVNQTAVYFRRGTDLRVSLGIDESGDLGEGCYSPLGVTLIHELQHIMQVRPASFESADDNSIQEEDLPHRAKDLDIAQSLLIEVGPTLYSLVLEDSIYKQIHQIDINEVVESYGQLDVDGHKVQLGEIANKMRYFFFDKYAEEVSIDKVLTKPDVLQQLNEWGGKGQTQSYSLMMAQQRDNSGR